MAVIGQLFGKNLEEMGASDDRGTGKAQLRQWLAQPAFQTNWLIPVFQSSSPGKHNLTK